MSSGVSTFSYAQAAKSPAVKATPIESQQSTAVVSPKSLAVTDAPGNVADIAAETIGEPVQSAPSTEAHTEDASSISTETVTIKQSQPAIDSTTQQGDEKNTPAAPEFGAESTDTLVREGDVKSTSSTRSSETTWEKVSQTSGTEEVAADNGKPEGETSPKVDLLKLKEAPIPSVNPWAKRAEDLAKNKDTNSTSAMSNQQKSTSGFKSGSSTFPGKTAQVNGTQKPKPFARASGPPPPSADAQAWPKPETAVAEADKKKTADTEEGSAQDKEKTSSRTKWVKVDHIPNPVFNTPLPRRGGRAPRGGRDGAPGRGHAAATGSRRTTSPGSHAYDSNHSSRNESASNERKSNASPRTVDSQANTTKTESNTQNKVNGHITSNPESSSERQSFNVKANAFNGEPKPLNVDATAFEGQQNFRQKRHSTAFTDTTSVTGDDYRGSRYNPRDRERGEYRGERGRGGYRGRGGHGSFEASQYPFTQPLPQEGFYSSRNQSFSEQRSPPYQGQGHQYGAPREHRHGRQNSRSMSIPSPQYNNRFNGHQPMAINTDFGGNGFYPMMASGSMSAGPFGYVDPQESITSQIQIQLEYYFSTDNLLKDIFLRKNMDNSGWILLSVISGFKRVRDLSSDVQAIRAACLRSRLIELQVGQDDDRDRIRKVDDWPLYVLPEDQRVSGLQYSEPIRLREPLLPLWIQDEMHHVPYMPYGRQQMSPMSFGPDFSQGFPTPFTPHAAAFVSDFMPNNTNGYRDDHHNSVMSPNVPDFTPGLGVSYQNMQHQVNGQHSPTGNEHVDVATNKLANLNLDTNKPVEVNGNTDQHLTNGVSEKEQSAASASQANETAA